MKRLLAIAWWAVKVQMAAALVLFVVLLGAVRLFPYPTEQLSPSKSGPLLVVDRHGTLLRSLPAADGSPGRSAWVPLDQVAPAAVQTLLASEDARFFEHRGVDPWGVLRALFYNLREGQLGYGGSTITQQLVRNVHFPRESRSLWRKVREAVLALRLERAMGKREILEQYLNRVYYGNQAYGIEAAARTYFGKPAASLSVGEATLLSVLPRAPGPYDPVRRLGLALRRRDHVFGLLQKQGLLDGGQVSRARAEQVRPRLHRLPFLAPHFVRYATQALPESMRSRGGTLRTTLDLPLQTLLERRVAEHAATLVGRGLDQAGLVVLDTRSGEVLAMVGSAGWDGPSGQVNIATRRRHPGSALKPFVYALALEAGDSPGTVAYDVRDLPSTARREGTGSQPEHGPVRYREALAGSYNLAAVQVLERVGIDAMVTRLRQAGAALAEGDPRDYGLRLALGAAKVRLIDLASAYGFLVRDGRVRKAQPLLSLTLADSTAWRPEPEPERPVFSPQVSWLVMDMLADPEARRPAFGLELPLDLPFRVAAKTGTARGFADTVAVGVTREVTVAAWAGTFDGRSTHGVMGMKGAAPLLREALLAVSRGRALTLPPRPEGLTTASICPLSGLPAGPHCPHRKPELFVQGKLPPTPCTWHRRENGRLTVHYPPELRGWATREKTRGGRHL